MSTPAQASLADAIAAPRPGEVQLWSLNAESFISALPAASLLLSAEERARIGRIRLARARDESILARASLRALLGHMLQLSPQAVTILTGADGKPHLAPDPSAIAFNVAHSHGHILLVFTAGVAVGVDIERINPKIEAEDIAQQNFAPSEQHLIASAVNVDERAKTFARIWVRKEAILKAHGAGLLLPLASFAVSLASTEQPVGLDNTQTFFLRELSAPTGFAAALAAAQPNLQLHRHELSPAFFTKAAGR